MTSSCSTCAAAESSEAEARRLVVHGFFADIIRRVGVPEIEQRLLAAVEAELAVTVGLPS